MRKVPYIDMRDPYHTEVIQVRVDGEVVSDHWLMLDARNGEGIRWKKNAEGGIVNEAGKPSQLELVKGTFEIFVEDWEAPGYKHRKYVF